MLGTGITKEQMNRSRLHRRARGRSNVNIVPYHKKEYCQLCGSTVCRDLHLHHMVNFHIHLIKGIQDLGLEIDLEYDSYTEEEKEKLHAQVLGRELLGGFLTLCDSCHRTQHMKEDFEEKRKYWASLTPEEKKEMTAFKREEGRIRKKRIKLKKRLSKIEKLLPELLNEKLSKDDKRKILIVNTVERKNKQGKLLKSVEAVNQGLEEMGFGEYQFIKYKDMKKTLENGSLNPDYRRVFWELQKVELEPTSDNE